jgi:multiple sugar transport system substrate-binding protein
VTITALFMTQAGYTDDEVKAMTDAFTAANPSIKVDLQFVSYEALHEKIVTDQLGGSGQYDIVLQDAIWGPEFAVAGISADVTDSIPADMLSGVFGGVLVGTQYQGRYYGIPWLNDTQYLYYNKTMLQKAGFSAPPSTWDEMEQQALAMKQKGIIDYPFVGQYKQGEALVANWTSTAGGFGMTDFVDAQGNPTFNTGGSLQALEYMKKLLDEGVTNPASTNYVSNDVKGALLSGQAAFGIVWAYVYADSLDPAKSKVVGEIGIAPMAGGGHACNGGMSLAITKNAKHRQEAIDYALYLASQPVEEKYVTAALPMWKSSFEKPELSASAPELWAAAEVAYQGMINRPMVPFYTPLSNALQVALQEALLGQKTPKAALDGVVAQWGSLQSQ